MDFRLAWIPKFIDRINEVNDVSIFVGAKSTLSPLQA